MSTTAELLQPDSAFAPRPALAAVATGPRDLIRSEDAALVRSLLANEPDAFRRLWQRFFQGVRARLQRVLGSDVEVDDLVQEVFLSLLSSVHRLREPEALSAFVLTVTQHVASRELRRRRARRHISLDLVPLEASAIGVWDTAAHHAFGQLENVLGRLKERDRLAFTLHYVERMNAREIAEALGVSVSTARRCFVHAWKRVAFLADRNLFLSDYLDESGRSATGRKSKLQ